MKNYKRAYRRHKKHVKFLRRVKIWFSDLSYDNGNREYYKNLTLQGKHYKFLKTTSTPCSCSMCAYDKYVREQKQYRFNKNEN